MIFKALLLLSFVQERKKKKKILCYFSPLSDVSELQCSTRTKFTPFYIQTKGATWADLPAAKLKTIHPAYIWGVQCFTLPSKIHFESFSPYNYLNSYKLYQYLHGIFSCPCSFDPPESLFGSAAEDRQRLCSIALPATWGDASGSGTGFPHSIQHSLNFLASRASCKSHSFDRACDTVFWRTTIREINACMRSVFYWQLGEKRLLSPRQISRDSLWL